MWHPTRLLPSRQACAAQAKATASASTFDESNVTFHHSQNESSHQVGMRRENIYIYIYKCVWNHPGILAILCSSGWMKANNKLPSKALGGSSLEGSFHVMSAKGSHLWILDSQLVVLKTFWHPKNLSDRNLHVKAILMTSHDNYQILSEVLGSMSWQHGDGHISPKSNCLELLFVEYCWTLKQNPAVEYMQAAYFSDLKLSWSLKVLRK